MECKNTFFSSRISNTLFFSSLYSIFCYSHVLFIFLQQDTEYWDAPEKPLRRWLCSYAGVGRMVVDGWNWLRGRKVGQSWFLGNLDELSFKNMTKPVNSALMKYSGASNFAPRTFRHGRLKIRVTHNSFHWRRILVLKLLQNGTIRMALQLSWFHHLRPHHQAGVHWAYQKKPWFGSKQIEL